MKKLLFLFSMVFILVSCSQEDDVIGQTNEVISDPSQDMSLKYALHNTINLDNIIPVYRYHGSGDHYYSLTKPSNETYASSMVFKSKTYSYLYQEFCISKVAEPYTKPLYRLYSGASDSHMMELNTHSTYYGFVNDGLLGYIFTYQKVGTVPLMEYYSADTKKHNYIVLQREIEWLKDNNFWEPGNYRRIVGYVYPGKRSENQATRKKIIITNNSNKNYTALEFKVNYKDANGISKVEDLNYEMNFSGSWDEQKEIDFPENCTIISGTVVLLYGIPYQKTVFHEDMLFDKGFAKSSYKPLGTYVTSQGKVKGIDSHVYSEWSVDNTIFTIRISTDIYTGI